MLQTRSALPELGSGARALCGARCPRVAVPVPPALVACFICFRKCLWHGAALSGASGSPCSREGRPGGHRGRIGGPPSLGRVVLCHPPAGAVGTRVTCFSCGTRSAPTLLRPCSLLRAGSGGPVFPPKSIASPAPRTSPAPAAALGDSCPASEPSLAAGIPPRAAGAGRRVWGWLFSPLKFHI